MEIHLIDKAKIEEYKEWVLLEVDKYPWITPSALALKSWYSDKGFKDFRFTDARAIGEQTKNDYLSRQKKKISE